MYVGNSNIFSYDTPNGALNDLIKIHDLFEWLHDNVRSCYNHAFDVACSEGHLDVVKWLYTVFHITMSRSNENYAFKSACVHGHLDVAQWLYTTFQLTVDDVRSFDYHALRMAQRNCHQDVCKWLVATFGDICYS